MLGRIFTSKVRVKILTVFMINPEKEMFVREIERITKENINAVRRELSNLEDIGLLKSKKQGNMKYYSVNKDFPIYEELKSIILKTEGIANFINSNLSQIGEIKLAFIYGSFASGKEDAGSDIDIFLVGKVNEDKIIKEILNLEDELSREINYVLFSEEEFEQRMNDKDTFVTNVLREPKIMIIGRFKC